MTQPAPPPPPRGLIGAVHLPALPGDPSWGGGDPATVIAAASRDAEALAAGGADAIIVENFGSWPFVKGDASQPTPPSTIALMALAVRAVRGASGLPVGVNVLRNDALAALGIAAVTGSTFIRVNVLSGAVVTDQGLIEGPAAALLRARTALGAPVAILADVRVKHARPLVDRPLRAEVEDLVRRAGADGLIVSGEGTGRPIDPAVLAEVAQAAAERLVVLGSGVDERSARTLGPSADAAIVGTALKVGGDVRAPVDPDRVRRVAQALRASLRAR